MKGKPGSGKSTLMKAAFSHLARPDHAPAALHTAAFFFNARGRVLERTPLGMLRSLLYQLLTQSPERLSCFNDIYHKRAATTNGSVSWHEEELRSFFKELFATQQPSQHRTIIFVDALDECELDRMRDLACFL